MNKNHFQQYKALVCLKPLLYSVSSMVWSPTRHKGFLLTVTLKSKASRRLGTSEASSCTSPSALASRFPLMICIMHGPTEVESHLVLSAGVLEGPIATANSYIFQCLLVHLRADDCETALRTLVSILRCSCRRELGKSLRPWASNPTQVVSARGTVKPEKSVTETSLLAR